VTANDPYDLRRFALAQNAGGTYAAAVAELRAGRKVGHWMWFVFPQVAGLGRSPVARAYAVSGLDEARTYLAHPVLGPRLLRCCRTILDLDGPSAVDVLGAVDAMKLRSSMTLFARADPDQPLFTAVLDRYFHGEPDAATDELLRGSSGRL
jgi:uncharacterized protein (DUF1810 family)